MQEKKPTQAPRIPFWMMAALLGGLALVSYWPALSGELIWNDHDYITKPALRTLAGLGRIWTQPGATEQYYPLLHSTFWLQGWLWGDYTPGYHLVTLALHVTAAILFVLILRRLAIPGAWLAGMIFALHPVHVESVAWITEQKNTLSLVFYLAAALSYLRFDEARNRSAYGCATGWFALSLLCKTVTATLPAALLVILWWKRGRLEWRRDILPLLPWLAIGAAAGLFTSWVEQHYVGARGEDFQLPLLNRGLIASRALWFYLGQIIWPGSLNFVYPRWTMDPTALWPWLFPLGLLLLIVGLWRLRLRTRAPLAVLLLFAGSLSPVLGFVNLYGSLYSWVWDHWQYLPDLGPMALLAAGLTRGWESLGARWRPFGVGFASLLILSLSTLTWQHAAIFHDSETLFRATLARNPACWMAHNNLANLLVTKPGQEAEARSHYEQAVQLNPDHAPLHNNLALLLARQPSSQAAARAQYEQALQLWPNFAEAHRNLAALLVMQPGHQREALTHYETALRIKPDYLAAHIDLASLLANWPGREAEAIIHAEQALQLDPLRADAHYILAVIFSRQNRIKEASSHCSQALQIDPHYEPARRLMLVLKNQ